LIQGGSIVVKVGSSSLSTPIGLDEHAVAGIVDQIASLVRRGNPSVLVTSGAIAAGFPALGLATRPTDIADLQVAAAVGQTRLMERYASRFAAHGLTVGQVLLTRDVLGNRTQYLNARAALTRMIERGIIPIVNENDTVVVDEVRLGDNDQLAAITSHLVSADMLVILTDTPGLFTDDPRLTADAKLLRAVEHTDEVLDRIRASSATGAVGSGGVATKVAAARMAAFSGIPTVVAPSSEIEVLERVADGREIGTWVDPRPTALPSRKLWIAFGLAAEGTIDIDEGAAHAIESGGRSLLAVGVAGVHGTFEPGDAVDVTGPGGGVIARGITRLSSGELSAAIGHHSSRTGGEVIHRDDLVVLAP